MARWHQITRRVALLAYLTITTFLVAHAVNGFVSEALYMPPDARTTMSTPASASGSGAEPSHYVADILASGLFPLPQERTEVGQVAALGAAVAAPHAPPLDAARKINVMGTVVGDREGVLAVIEELPGKKQGLYRLHDQIPNVGELAEIRHNAVLIRQGYQEEWVELAIAKQTTPATMEGAVVAAPKIGNQSLHKILDRREVTQVTEDLPKLLTQVRATPYLINGKLEGFRIDNIAPASFFDKVGIRGGDILQRVNGVEIRDPGTMLSLFQQLKNERTVRLDVLRDNKRAALTYEIR